ncbi:hypothetical protein [Mariprofundus sp. KV]|uniref:hypothetical protein n=1 Tax=Mariprofundus sp. KV TaxID=2608715 RepID=UPI0015A03607|nr:hypothetical protein [Mariprofundus sp. KV]NWF35545.1 hypothetical protein [Mariprofundus sp. KV]
MLDYRLSQPSTWMLPFLFVALFLCTSPSLSFLFNGTTRWGFVLLGFLWVLSRNQWGMIFRSPLALVTMLLFAWPFITVIWSIETSLSLFKATGFIVISCTMFALGAAWAWRQGERALDLLFPFMGIFFLILVTAGIPTEIASGYGQLYEGAGNPNLTGIAAAFCVPLVLYRMFVHGGSHRLLWWTVLLALIYVFLAALSRNAMLVAGITGFGCLIGMGAKRKTIVMTLAALSAPAVIIITLLLPQLISNASNFVYGAIIMKGALERAELEDSPLASRAIPFLEQAKAAKEGGILGGGYGAQIEVGHYVIINNQPKYFKPGSYKREKANSALAIMEEQGLVGLAITTIWLFMLFRLLIRQYRRSPPGNARLLLGIMTAFLFAMLLHSMFEAWWVSPGSLEALVFWAMAGLTYGFGQRVNAVYLTDWNRNLGRSAQSEQYT